MADTNVQLPPNSSGQQIRVETGDQTNLIPTGVGEEVVIPSDAQGLFPGDGRMAALPVREETAQEILTVLYQLLATVCAAHDIDPVSATDALSLGG